MKVSVTLVIGSEVLSSEVIGTKVAGTEGIGVMFASLALVVVIFWAG